MLDASTSIPDFTNTVIGRYRLIHQLGSGAYGVVYKVVDTLAPSSSSAEPVYHAMKIVRKAGHSAQDLANFQREIALHSALAYHPNIVRVHEVDEDIDYFYIIMEYCPGGDLFDLIVSSPYAMCGTAVQDLFLSLIDGVQACHDSGVAHRDIKPENLLVSEDGTKVLLADFGVATDQHQCEDFGAGTSTYMAPECYGPSSYCPRTSDIWALGVVFLNLTCELNPWEKATLEDPAFVDFFKRRHASSTTAHLSEGARVLLRRMLEVDPTERVALPELRSLVFNLDAVFAPDSDTESEPDIDEYQQVACAAIRGSSGSSQHHVGNPTSKPAGLGITRASTSAAFSFAHHVEMKYPPGLGLIATLTSPATTPHPVVPGLTRARSAVPYTSQPNTAPARPRTSFPPELGLTASFSGETHDEATVASKSPDWSPENVEVLLLQEPAPLVQLEKAVEEQRTLASQRLESFAMFIEDHCQWYSGPDYY